MSPFDFTKQIEHGKQNLIDENPELEKEYKPFIVNRALSFSHDMVLYANLMNEYNHLDSKLQFDFFLNSLRPRKRFSPWAKAKKLDDLEYVKEYYGYNNEKAKVALDILDDEQISAIKQRTRKGGKNGTS